MLSIFHELELLHEDSDIDVLHTIIQVHEKSLTKHVDFETVIFFILMYKSRKILLFRTKILSKFPRELFNLCFLSLINNLSVMENDLISKNISDY